MVKNCWHLFSWWASKHFTFSFGFKTTQYFIYNYMQPIALQINQDTGLRFIHTPLTLIVMMWQGAFYIVFGVKLQPILGLLQCATNRPMEYPRHITKNRWPSIDAHFHDGAGSILNSLLPIKTAKTSFITICNLSPPRWLKMNNKESLKPHRRSFSWLGRECFSCSFAYNGSQYSIYNYLKLIATQITQDT
jgi:hypothetical protein